MFSRTDLTAPVLMLVSRCAIQALLAGARADEEGLCRIGRRGIEAAGARLDVEGRGRGDGACLRAIREAHDLRRRVVDTGAVADFVDLDQQIGHR